ncbi:PKD domain-containing protein (plasmid) [Halorientalis pallida]|uniref:PKD domain-containing protein n=1 Tax=Halorientalis pallida TaxID=2479928 RepID=UPI003C705ABD
MSGTVVDASGSTIGGATVRIYDGNSLVWRIETIGGEWAVPVPEGSYRVVSEANSVTSEVTAQQGSSGSQVSITVDRCSSGNSGQIFVSPENPSVGKPVTFSSCQSGSNVQWEFGDGTTATGSEVTHTYSSSGTYNVQRTANGNTISREIDLSSSELAIDDVSSPNYYGPAFEGFNQLPVEYVVNITSAGTSVQSVTAYLGGDPAKDSVSQSDVIKQVQLSKNKTGQWRGEVNIGAVSKPRALTFRVEASNGDIVRETVQVEYTELSWLGWLIKNVGRSPTGIQIDTGKSLQFQNTVGVRYEVGPFEVDTLSSVAPWDKTFEAGGEVAFQAGPKIPKGVLVTYGELDGEVGAAGISVFANGKGKIEVGSDGEITNAELEAKAGIRRDLFTFNPSILGYSITDLEVTGSGYINLKIDEAGFTDNQFRAGGSAGPGLALTGEADLGVDGAKIHGEARGEVNGLVGVEYPATATYPVPFVKNDGSEINAKLEALARVQALFFSNEKKVVIVDASLKPGDFSGATIPARTVQTQTTGWNVQSRGDSQPLKSVPAVGEPRVRTQTTSPLGSAATTSHARLSDRKLTDTQPSIGKFGDHPVAVWSRQGQTRAVTDGRDIVARVKNNGTWDDPIRITNDTKHDGQPVVGGSDDGFIAAWSRVDAEYGVDYTTPGGAAPHQEIAVVSSNGSGVSQKTLLTNSSKLEHQPTVAKHGEKALVAWEQNGGNRTKFGERSVRYALLDGSSVIERGEIDDAARPDVGLSPNDEFELIYVEPGPNGTASGDIISGTVTASGQFTEQFRTSVTGFGTVVTDGGQAAWTGRANGQSYIGYYDGSATEQIDPSGNLSQLDEVTLDVDGDTTLLTYRGQSESASPHDIVYRVAKDGQWITDRRLTGVENENLSLFDPNSILDVQDGTFSVVYSVENNSQGGSSDVFVSKSEFDQTYTLEASGPDNATAGETVSINYTVRNVGEVADTDTVNVQLWSGSQIVKAQSIGPLDANGTTTGQFTTTVPDDGQVEVKLESSAVDPEQASWLPTNETLRFAEPVLSVTQIRSERLGADKLEVTATINNNGTADATNVPVAVVDGSTRRKTVTADRVPYNGTDNVTAILDPDTLNTTTRDSVSLNPNGTMPSDWIKFDSLPAWLLQPNVQVFEPTSYRLGPNGTVATFQVANSGDAAADVTLNVTDVSSGTQLARTNVTLPAAVDTGQHSESVTVTMPDVTAADENNRNIQISAETAARDERPGSTVVRDTVGPFAPVTGTVTVTLNKPSGGPVENASVFLDAVGSRSDANGTVTLTAQAGNATLRVNASGYAEITRNVTVPGNGVETVNVTLGKDQSPLAEYANNNGVVDVNGLLAAIDDFRSDEIDVNLLLDTIDAFRSGDPVQ